MSEAVVHPDPVTLEGVAVVRSTDPLEKRCILICWRPGGGWKVWDKLMCEDDAIATADNLSATWAERRIYKLPDDPVATRKS
jgi:hypothetical protein